METTHNHQDQELFLLEAADRAQLLHKVNTCLQQMKAGMEVVSRSSIVSTVSAEQTLRLALLFCNSYDLQEKLISAKNILSATNKSLPGPSQHCYLTDSKHQGKTMWLFPGFGSEYPHMLTGLNQRFSSVGKWLNLMEQLLSDGTTQPPTGQQDIWIERQLQNKAYGLHEIGPYGSLTSLAIQEVLQELNMPCHGMLGHSNGENASLLASGTLTFENQEQLLQIIASATSLAKPAHEKGQYLVVSHIKEIDIQLLLAQFEGTVELAMKNCPGQTVFYLAEEKRAEVLAYIKKQRLLAFDLYTDHPYHTSFFASRAQELASVYNTFTIAPSRIPVYSCVNASVFPTRPAAIKKRALEQWTQPVLFKEAIEHAYQEGFDTFIEIGPGNRLQGFVKDSLRGKKHKAFCCGKKTETAWNGLLQLAAALWVNHVPLRIEALLPATEPKKTPATKVASSKQALFEAHQELMQQFLSVNQRITTAYLGRMDARIPTAKKTAVGIKGPLLNGAIKKIDQGIEIHTLLHTNDYPIVNDHAMGGKLPVVPFTLSMELIAEAAALFPGFEKERITLSDVKGNAWLVYDTQQLSLRITAQKSEGSLVVKVYGVTEGVSDETPAFEGLVSSIAAKSPSMHKGIAQDEKQAPSISIATFYKEHLFHGPCFESMHKVQHWNRQGVYADFKMPPIAQGMPHLTKPAFKIPGAMLDSCGQLMAYWLYEMGIRNYAIFPFRAQRFEQYQAFPSASETLRCKAIITRQFGMLSGDFEFESLNGQRLGCLQGFQLKMYQNEWIPILLMNRLQNASITHLDPQFLEEGAGIWKKVWAKSTLNPAAYLQWLQMPGSQQVEHLFEQHQSLLLQS